jgi:hypothetical protein
MPKRKIGQYVRIVKVPYLINPGDKYKILDRPVDRRAYA